MRYSAGSIIRVLACLVLAVLMSAALLAVLFGGDEVNSWLSQWGIGEPQRSALLVVLPIGISTALAIALIPGRRVQPFRPLQQVVADVRTWDLPNHARANQNDLETIAAAARMAHMTPSSGSVDSLMASLLNAGFVPLRVAIEHDGSSPLVQSTPELLFDELTRSSPFRGLGMPSPYGRALILEGFDADRDALTGQIVNRWLSRDGFATAFCHESKGTVAEASPAQFLVRTTDAWRTSPVTYFARSYVWNLWRYKYAALALLAAGLVASWSEVVSNPSGIIYTLVGLLLSTLILFGAPALLTFLSLGLQTRSKSRLASTLVSGVVFLVLNRVYNQDVVQSAIIASIVLVLTHRPAILVHPVRVLGYEQLLVGTLVVLGLSIATPMPGTICFLVVLALLIMKWTALSPLVLGLLSGAWALGDDWTSASSVAEASTLLLHVTVALPTVGFGAVAGVLLQRSGDGSRRLIRLTLYSAGCLQAYWLLSWWEGNLVGWGWVSAVSAGVGVLIYLHSSRHSLRSAMLSGALLGASLTSLAIVNEFQDVPSYGVTLGFSGYVLLGMVAVEGLSQSRDRRLWLLFLGLGALVTGLTAIERIESLGIDFSYSYFDPLDNLMPLTFGFAMAAGTTLALWALNSDLRWSRQSACALVAVGLSFALLGFTLQPYFLSSVSAANWVVVPLAGALLMAPVWLSWSVFKDGPNPILLIVMITWAYSSIGWEYLPAFSCGMAVLGTPMTIFRRRIGQPTNRSTATAVGIALLIACGGFISNTVSGVGVALVAGLPAIVLALVVHPAEGSGLPGSVLLRRYETFVREVRRFTALGFSLGLSVALEYFVIDGPRTPTEFEIWSSGDAGDPWFVAGIASLLALFWVVFAVLLARLWLGASLYVSGAGRAGSLPASLSQGLRKHIANVA